MFEYYLNHTQKSMPHFYYRSDKVLHTRCGLRYLFLLNLILFFKGGHRLGVRSPQVSSLEIPLSLGTTKGLSPFGIPNYLFIVIF